jgi:peptide alpha-N-acetyltransferase
LFFTSGSKAVEILEAYEGTLEDDYPPDNERCELGEMLLYKVTLLTSYISILSFRSFQLLTP